MTRLPLAFGAYALALALAGSGPAAAQEMYPGQNVSVNPAAINQVPCVNCPYAAGVLPAGAGRRNLPPVHLRPPKRHKPHRRHTAAASSPSSESTRTAIAEAPPAASKPAPKVPHNVVHKAARRASPPPASNTGETGPAAIPFSFGGDSSPPPPSPPKQAAKPAPRHLAKAAPLPKTTLPKIAPPKGLTKQQVVLFDTGSSALSDNSKARLNDLAFSLKTALANGASQIELIAYAGAPGDKSSAARRLSLKRALAVREALIVDGVPASRIDVRALGGVPAGDNGATDRVDIFVKA